ARPRTIREIDARNTRSERRCSGPEHPSFVTGGGSCVATNARWHTRGVEAGLSAGDIILYGIQNLVAGAAAVIDGRCQHRRAAQNGSVREHEATGSGLDYSVNGELVAGGCGANAHVAGAVQVESITERTLLDDEGKGYIGVIPDVHGSRVGIGQHAEVPVSRLGRGRILEVKNRSIILGGAKDGSVAAEDSASVDVQGGDGRGRVDADIAALLDVDGIAGCDLLNDEREGRIRGSGVVADVHGSRVGVGQHTEVPVSRLGRGRILEVENRSIILGGAKDGSIATEDSASIDIQSRHRRASVDTD